MEHKDDTMIRLFIFIRTHPKLSSWLLIAVALGVLALAVWVGGGA